MTAKNIRIHPFYYGETVEIFLTNQCNCSCIFCHSIEFEGEPTLNQVKTFLTDAEKKQIKTIQFTGGEPTLNKDFFEIINFAKNSGFPAIRVVSNGRKFSDLSFAKAAHEAGLNGYLISIQSHIAETHDELVDCPGAFDETVSGFKNLLSLTYPENITTNTIITKRNYRHLPQLVEFLNGLGIKKSFFCFPSPHGACLKNFDRLVPYHAEARPYIIEAIESIQNKTKELALIDNYPLCFLEKYENYACALNLPVYPDTGQLCCPKRNNCLYGKICHGIQKNYILKRGWEEFSPTHKQYAANKKKLFLMSACLIPKIDAEVFKTPLGAHLRTKDHKLILLKPPGHSVIKKIDAKTPLKNLFSSANKEILNFLGSLYMRGAVQFINGCPIISRQENKIHTTVQNHEFEYETYNNTNKNYPLVTYTQ